MVLRISDDIASVPFARYSSRYMSVSFDAIKGFMEAQANGDDVYMDTLGHMRQFPFFHNVANWFLPFHTSHSELADVTDGEGAAIAGSNITGNSFLRLNSRKNR